MILKKKTSYKVVARLVWKYSTKVMQVWKCHFGRSVSSIWKTNICRCIWFGSAPPKSWKSESATSVELRFLFTNHFVCLDCRSKNPESDFNTSSYLVGLEVAFYSPLSHEGDINSFNFIVNLRKRF